MSFPADEDHDPVRGPGDVPAAGGDVDRGRHQGPLEDELDAAFDRLVEEGAQRLGRTTTEVLVTGFFGGTEVALGVLAFVAVYRETGSHLLGGLAFSIGFLSLLLARSELFTEGFMIPIVAVAARRARPIHLAKLWGGVLVMNLLGGWLVMWLVVIAFPGLHESLIELASEYVLVGFGARGMALAVLAGAAMTLLTRMQAGTGDITGKMGAAIAIAFLLVGTGLFHSILDSLLIFGALHTGDAPFDYGTWLGWIWYVLIGNMIGGLVLVTGLRLLRSKDRLLEERSQAMQERLSPEPSARNADGRQQIQRERREQAREETEKAQRKADELDQLDESEKARRFRRARPRERDTD
ncbi:formate/nitrite transporter family protein [Nocardioidaceae bacterium]|nr:formate/nitrite transporter family protein [Nocardioidaceae bacterium]